MPQVIGAAILTALGASASATAASLVGGIVVAGALTGAQLLLAPKPDIPKPKDGKVSIKQPIPPAIYAYGRCRISGAYLAYELKGSTSHDVIALHQGRIDGYERFYLNDDLVVFSSTTTEGPGDGSIDGPVRLPGPYKGRYMGDEDDEKNTRIYWRKGETPSPAYPLMTAAFPGLWTADHRNDGIATLHLICEMPDEKSYTRRFPFGLPRPSVVARWRCCWDPRDPTQNIANPSTWKWSDNPIVCLLDFFCHHPAGYLRPIAEVFTPKSDWWFAGMDLCDELVAKADGTSIKRYTCGGQFTSETPRKSVLEALLRSCDGWLCEYGDGSVVVYAGGYFPPSITIEDRHIYDLRVSRGRLPDERVTKLNLSVSSPDHDYDSVPCDPWLSRRAQDAGAPPIARDVKAEWVQEWTQMRRLGKIEDEKSRCELRGTLVGRPYFENLRGRRYFMLNCTQQRSTRMVPCEVVDFHDNSFENGSYEVEFQSVDPTMRYGWTPATDEGRRPAIPDKTEDDDFPVPPLPTLGIVRKTAGGATYATISATAPPVDGWPDLTLGGRYRKKGEGDDKWIDMLRQKKKLQCLSGPVEEGLHEVQTFYVGGGGGEGDMSPVAEINVVVDIGPPSPPEALQVSVSGGVVTFSARAGDSSNTDKMVFRRGTTSQTYFQASLVIQPHCRPNQTLGPFTETPGGSGVRRYWVDIHNGSNIPSGSPLFMDVTL